MTLSIIWSLRNINASWIIGQRTTAIVPSSPRHAKIKRWWLSQFWRYGMQIDIGKYLRNNYTFRHILDVKSCMHHPILNSPKVENIFTGWQWWLKWRRHNRTLKIALNNVVYGKGAFIMNRPKFDIPRFDLCSHGYNILAAKYFAAALQRKKLTFFLLSLYTYIHTYIRTYVRTYVRTYIHTYIHT